VRVRGLGWLICLALIGAAGGCSFFGESGPEYTYWEPTLSPDGRSLAYESPADGNLDLFVRDLVTGEERRLTQNDYPDWSPVWSPDGSRIAFSSSREKNVDIYILDVETLSVHRVTTHEADDINPHWGIDDRIYFNSNRSGTWEIYAVDANGQSLVKITQVVEPAER